MNHSKPESLPAPCVVDRGIVVQKEDMLRLLRGLRKVKYIYRQDNGISSTGEGCVIEAFCDPNQATLVANHSLYLNVDSFDYVELTTQDAQTTFSLVQEDRCLCLTPINDSPSQGLMTQLDAADLEVIVNEAIAASWDASLDDDTASA